MLVRKDAICPGYTADMVSTMPQGALEKSILLQIAAGRSGEPDELARRALFLASA